MTYEVEAILEATMALANGGFGPDTRLEVTVGYTRFEAVLQELRQYTNPRVHPGRIEPGQTVTINGIGGITVTVHCR